MAETFGCSTYLAVRPTTLPRSYFKFPPASVPATLPPPPPPAGNPTLARPFEIPTNVYNALLEPTVPVTIAIVYISVVLYLNTINSRSKQPWAISQTSLFKPFVVLHNAFLAAYSAWTFIGMFNAVAVSFVGWTGDYGLAGAVDSLCKINGPRGLGSSAFFNEASSAWTITNKAFHLAADGLTPETTDVGRMWNEGLAFYGWLFYVSKFYEVIDTFIILSKGRKSSFLQTYHHAGAMLCMWAGLRYMSPPIWMFVLVNSGIHAIMYTFYFCTALGLPINKRLKQVLTTMQITQFVVGTIYAFAHLFVAYQIPVSVPYLYHLGSAIKSVASALPSGVSSAGSSVVASASARAGAGAWLKKAALRAAGREGLAENVLNDQGQTFGVDAVHVVADLASREETRFRDELQWTHCLDTSGQVFAILLNCLYLAPLTGLFVRFFVKAYLKRMERRRSSAGEAAVNALRDASKGFARKIEEVHGSEGKEPAGNETTDQVDTAREKLSSATGKVKESFDKGKLNEEFSNGMKQLKQSMKEKQGELRQDVEDAISASKDEASKLRDEITSKAANSGKQDKSDTVQAEEENSAPGSPNESGTGEGEATGEGKEVEDEKEGEKESEKEQKNENESSQPGKEDAGATNDDKSKEGKDKSVGPKVERSEDDSVIDSTSIAPLEPQAKTKGSGGSPSKLPKAKR